MDKCINTAQEANYVHKNAKMGLTAGGGGAILAPILPIWGLSKWKQNSRLLNYEWIGVLVLIIVIWGLLLYFIGPDFLFSLE